jgi:hypothetical protein
LEEGIFNFPGWIFLHVIGDQGVTFNIGHINFHSITVWPL